MMNRTSGFFICIGFVPALQGVVSLRKLKTWRKGGRCRLC